MLMLSYVIIIVWLYRYPYQEWIFFFNLTLHLKGFKGTFKGTFKGLKSIYI